MKTTLKFYSPIKVAGEKDVKISLNGEAGKADDITACRYVFGAKNWLTTNTDGAVVFNSNTIECVNYNRSMFDKALHIIEVNITELMETTQFDLSGYVDMLRQLCPGVAIFVYIDCKGMEHIVQAATGLRTAFTDGKVDRLIVREITQENSQCLRIEDLKAIMDAICNAVGDKKCTEKIGFCNSPIGCSIGKSCLSAALCRELAAIYGDSIDMIIPTQNHEGLNNSKDLACNCLKYTIVKSLEFVAKTAARTSTKAPKDKSSKGTSTAPKKSGTAGGKKVVLPW